MPEVSEVRTVEYEALTAPQMPGEFQKYKGTKSTQWNITATLACRTREEAARNYIYVNTLRGWSESYFGDKQRIQFSDGGGRGKLGAPPPVLQFAGWRSLVGTVPVVLTSLNWSWPHDCDWIPSGILDPATQQEIPFPTVMQVQISLVESYSPQQMNNFDLVAFRNGRMVNAWSSTSATTLAPLNLAEPVGGNQSSVQGTAQAEYSNEGRNPTAPSTDYSNEGQNYANQVNTQYSNEGQNYAQADVPQYG
jgi:hypothetical protein